ncbi:hypothetical protein DL95DRAFT_389186 [Leptodontidium sp. 2 PMI_412]|nr:hypothetical protein BKA61DRAFT_510181 [Leptodontidium sp. MPI-SDFR-AT-0119]KAH9214873.1 hypothetical protein DL95DRAFT_389186 [Leptodontidium sp. 2 PMI_412]
MMSTFLTFLLLIIGLRQVLGGTSGEHGGDHGFGSCPPFSGTFTIKQYQLYPENVDFDFNSCLLYIGILFNASVGVYDPYKDKMVDILEFPGISHNPKYHIGGVGIDKRTGLLSIVVDDAAAFGTVPPDVSGTNFIMLWDPETKELLYKVNLTDTTHGKYGGFQDVEQDPDGNVYVVGTFPGSILKVDKSRGRRAPKVTPWYVPQPIDSTQIGFGGLAAKDWTLLVNDNNGGRMLRFDMRSSVGKPTVIPLTPNHTFAISDAIYLPPKYKGTVLLVAEDGPGVTVLRSKSGKWDQAEYLGTVPKNLPDSEFVTASVQVGDSLYMIVVPAGTVAGNATEFPVYDITAQVEKMLET